MNYFSILANVDSSILLFKLDDGFEIKKENKSDVIETICKLDNASKRSVIDRLIRNHISPDDEDNLYTLNNSFISSLASKEEYHSTFDSFGKKTSRLTLLFQKMRLFKEGNICFPLDYIYSEKDFITYQSSYGTQFITSEIYHLDPSEIPILNSFKIPFKDNLLKFAFKNFELSYPIHDTNLRFLSLMNAIEVLFHPSREGELRYRISRNLAILLGKDKEESQDYFNKMRILYDKRSDIVHRGNAEITPEDLLNLRHYVRESIKIFLKLDKNKDEILNSLTSRGFGDSPIKNI